MDKLKLGCDSHPAGPTGPLRALQGHMLVQHLVTTSAQEWAQHIDAQQPLKVADTVTRVPTPENPMYPEYQAHIITAAESRLDAIVESVALDGKTPLRVQETVGTVLCQLGALSLDHRSGWESVVATHLSTVLDHLAHGKAMIRFKKIQGFKFASVDEQDGMWLSLSEASSKTSQLESLPSSPSPQQPLLSNFKTSSNASNDSLLPIPNSPFAALSSTSAAHAAKGNHLTSVSVPPPTATECSSASAHSPTYPDAHTLPHAPSNLPNAAQPTPHPASLPCGHAGFKYDAQWTGQASTDPRPCFESGEQLLLAGAPIILASNGGSVLDFGPPSDSYWSQLMDAEQVPDRLSGFDTIREPVWQTHRSLAAIQLFGSMFDIPFTTCPMFAAHITDALATRMSDMVESGQVSSEEDMGVMAPMWVKEEVAWFLVREVLEMDGVEQSEVDGAFYLVEDDAVNRIECRESLLAAIELYRAEWGMPEPQIVVDGHDSAVDLPGLV